MRREKGGLYGETGAIRRLLPSLDCTVWENQSPPRLDTDSFRCRCPTCRGQWNRVELVKTLSATLGCHVIAVDYRGFADSTGWPSEEGTYTPTPCLFSQPCSVLRPWFSHRAVLYGSRRSPISAVRILPVGLSKEEDRPINRHL